MFLHTGVGPIIDGAGKGLTVTLYTVAADALHPLPLV
jgi:hypothetical protein